MSVKIDRDGLPFMAAAGVPAVAAAVLGRRRVAAALGLLTAGLTAFFRDPDRSPDHGALIDPDVVLAPADGKVMHVGPPEPGVAPVGHWQQISIFLSIFDVHINRAPYGGRITGVTHRPGRFRAAYRAKSAHENERSEITVVSDVDGEQRLVVFRQVVGVLARRVVTRVEPGQGLVTGQRIGLMRFGSRMDVFVPPEVHLRVSVGDRVVGGETELARWPQPIKGSDR